MQRSSNWIFFLLHDAHKIYISAAAVANGYLIQKLSQAKAALIGAVSFTLGFLILLFAVPFPVMCCFVVFVGYGSASLQACANVVVAELPKASMMVNFLHGKCLLNA